MCKTVEASFSLPLLFYLNSVFKFGSFSLASLTLSVYLRKWLFFTLGLLFEFISLYFNEGFLFHGEVVLFMEFLIFLLVLILESMEPFNILV